jgi:hypothetical protein
MALKQNIPFTPVVQTGLATGNPSHSYLSYYAQTNNSTEHIPF